MAEIILRHNMEVAHRLFELKGKCEQIHGHSMWVTIGIYGGINANGILETDAGALEFGEVKKTFRSYLDTNYDHHLLLNHADPWASLLELPGGGQGNLPGLASFPGDPTTEHLALWIAEWTSNNFATDAWCEVQETAVNAARVEWKYV